MKSVLFAVVFLIGSMAMASGDLVLGGYYLDDMDQSISPAAGIAVHSGLLGHGFSDSLYGGFGYLKPADVAGVSSPWYEEVKADVYYAVGASTKLGVGGGIIFNRQIYSDFDNHVHVTLTTNLW